MSEQLTLSTILHAVAGTAAAFRSITHLQPVGGEGDKIFPATYAGGTYAREQRRLTKPDGATETVDCVLINSVQSEANHAELALKSAGVPVPIIEVDFSATAEFRKPLANLTSLDVPHRLADAILRDSNTPDGERFSASKYAKSWSRANLWNATPIYQLCPTALVFGMWGSPDKPGGLGAKFERAFVSEVIAVDYVAPEKRYALRLDPVESSKHVSVIPANGGFTVGTGKNAVRPSEINHGNVPSETPNAGVRCRYVEQTTVISIGALRKLNFPVDNQQDADRDIAGRAVLITLGLAAAILASERGTSLRSRCHLWPTETRKWQLLETPGSPVREFQLTGAQVIGLLNEAIAHAESKGLVWMKEKLTLTPTPELLELIRKSQEVMAAESGEGATE